MKKFLVIAVLGAAATLAVAIPAPGSQESSSIQYTEDRREGLQSIQRLHELAGLLPRAEFEAPMEVQGDKFLLGRVHLPDWTHLGGDPGGKLYLTKYGKPQCYGP